VSTIDVDINIAGPDETDDESGGYDTTPAQDATAGCGCESGGSESGTNALLLVLVLLVLLSRRRDHERTSL
jgi:MYXO-CTERM domain-containing protein